MKRVLTGLGITLLGSVNLIACATDESADECLPGDIECAPADGADGKADGWDYKNDPERMSQRLTYKLADLPKKGTRTKPVWKDTYPDAVGKSSPSWADTYWPTSEGSHNNRWMGDSVKSPLEKYDAAFNNAAGCTDYPSKFSGAGAKAEWDEYYACAGPAAKWQSKEFQGGGDMHDGIDNDGDGKIDEQGADGVDGIASWWGTCHAWSPASMMVPEPQHAVEINGVKFEVGDIKALIQNAFDSTDAVMLGGRCNSRTIEHTSDTSANSDCDDGNPGALHVIMTNFLGIAQLPLVEDRTANYEVWNQPVYGYEVTKQAEISKTAANECVGSSGSTWTYNDKAKKLYEVKMTVQYITEGSASVTPLGHENNIRTDDYHYILELNDTGKIIGGRYCTDSTNDHIDFLWSPTGDFSPSNPNVSATKVKELITKSVAAGGGGGGGGGNGKVFRATPDASIPDDSTTGVKVDVPVTGVVGTPGLTVSVDITHTYRGDLVVDLLRDGRKVKTLHDKTGGSQQNLVESYSLAASDVGDANTTWSVQVSDSAAQDTGKVNSVTLEFK